MDYSYSYFDNAHTAMINGKQQPYDACSKKRNAYDPNKFNYIGKGVIHSIGDVKQLGKTKYFFFKKAF